MTDSAMNEWGGTSQEDSGDYSLVEPFDIDGRETGGLSPRRAFVLGVEWGQFREKLLLGLPFTMMVHEENQIRLSALARRHGREVAASGILDEHPPPPGFVGLTVEML